jgi:hypothetical protein
MAHTDGHLELAAGREGYGIEARSHFQQIRIAGPYKGIAIIELTYTGDKLGICINRADLRLLSQADGEIFGLQVREYTPSTHSLDDPDAKTACQKWVDSRRARFAKKKPPTPKKANRPKSLEEQLGELEDAVEALRDFSKDIQAGNKRLAPSLAAQLRALIYWPNDKPTWNPLLYRLANNKSLPLPVYSFPVHRNEPKIVREATYRARNLTPSVVRRTPTEVVMDLQEYTTSTVQTVRTDKGESNISIEETLGAAANSLGAAHYDETIALDVDLLQMHVYVNTSLLHRTLIGLGDAVVVLSSHVLKAYR